MPIISIGVDTHIVVVIDRGRGDAFFYFFNIKLTFMFFYLSGMVYLPDSFLIFSGRFDKSFIID